MTWQAGRQTATAGGREPNADGPSMLHFVRDDEWLVNHVEGLLCLLLHRRTLTSQQQRDLGVLLLGLWRLPCITEGINIELTLAAQGPSGGSWMIVRLDQDAFELSSGWSNYEPAVGDDHTSTYVFQAESGAFRECASFEELVDWLNRLREVIGLPEYVLTIANESAGDVVKDGTGYQILWDTGEWEALPWEERCGPSAGNS